MDTFWFKFNHSQHLNALRFELHMTLQKLFFWLTWFMMPMASWAGAFQDCAEENDMDQRNLCKGIAALSPTFCKDIKNGETRNHCYAKVRDGQRKFTWKPEPINENNTTKK